MNGKILNKEALKAWILSKVVTLTNNLLATTPGISAMDAAQGPVIQGQIDEINSNFGGLSFGMTEDGQPGYRKPGADTVTPFSKHFKFVAHLYSWVNQVLLYDCPQKIKFECKYKIYLFNEDTGTPISNGTSIILENNTAKNIRIRANSNFQGSGADGFSASDGKITITIH